MLQLSQFNLATVVRQLRIASSPKQFSIPGILNTIGDFCARDPQNPLFLKIKAYFQLLHGEKRLDHENVRTVLDKIVDDRLPDLAPDFTYPQLIGGGSSSWVYCGKKDSKTVAVKLGKGTDSIVNRKLFDREWAFLEALKGASHTVKAYEHGEASDRPYIVLEYMSGGSLQRFRESSELPQEWDVARQIVLGAVTAVAEIHDLGIIHSDIKPANFLKTFDHEVKLSDFSLATTTEQASAMRSQLVLKGTSGYVAPGMSENQSSDVFSLAASVYFLLTGKKPFGKRRGIDMLIQGPPAPPSQSSPWGNYLAKADEVILWGMDLNETRRPANAREFEAGLFQALR